MKVVLSIDAVQFPLTGIGRYTSELARNLQVVEPELDLRLMAGDQFLEGLPQENVADAKRERRSAGIRTQLQRSPLVVSLARHMQASRQARALRSHQDAVFHGPNFYIPRFAGRCVVTVHDLSVYAWAHCHPKGRVKLLRREIARSIKRANLILTVSEYTRREIGDFFNLPLDRIKAIALGSSAAFAPRPPVELAPALARWGLEPKGYCLYVGTIEPRKNLDSLLDAYQSLPWQTRQRWPLVLCGYRGWQSSSVHARIEAAERSGWARYLGYFPSDQLPLLFAGARLFAFPSLYEGFGLPVLEAMASGVPVVCSDSASLPEVLGDAGAMCAAQDRDALVRLVARGLEDEEWQTRACARGLERAASFSWLKCASETLDAYRVAMAG
jgi:glycosyltransferase involved in cell wall biosynthesis